MFRKIGNAIDDRIYRDAVVKVYPNGDKLLDLETFLKIRKKVELACRIWIWGGAAVGAVAGNYFGKKSLRY